MYALIFANAMLFLSTLSLRRATFGLGTPSILPQFLSTLSLRRATCPCQRRACRLSHFYPRSPCGERPGRIWSTAFAWYFYPRSPCGERRSPRTGFCRPRYFYPRSPCGERQGKVHVPIMREKFLSTLSLRRATFELAPANMGSNNFYPRSPCGERR